MLFNMTQLTNSSKPSTETQSTEAPQPPAPKTPSRRWLWLLLGSMAIAGIGVGIWYTLLRPKNDNLIPFANPECHQQ